MPTTLSFHHHVSYTATTGFGQPLFTDYGDRTEDVVIEIAAPISLRPLENSADGWSAAKTLFDRAPDTAAEFFGPHRDHLEGKMFFERVLADNRASKIEFFEIVAHSDGPESIGIVTLGTGYTGNTGAYIHFMFIVDDMRGLGIGGHALRLLEARAAHTSSYVSLLCALPESQSARFWRKNGYHFVGGLDANMKKIDDAIVAIFRKNLTQSSST